MVVVFFGHRQLRQESVVRERLKNEVEQLIKQGANKFLIGNHGQFDRVALSVCRELRKTYKDIKIIVVFTSLAVFQKDEYGISGISGLEDVETMTYPIEDEHFKNQIVVNNRYMVDDSDVVVGYVDMKEYRSGAKRAINYAKRQHKTVINLFKEEDRPFYGMTDEEIETQRKQDLENFNRIVAEYNLNKKK